MGRRLIGNIDYQTIPRKVGVDNAQPGTEKSVALVRWFDTRSGEVIERAAQQRYLTFKLYRPVIGLRGCVGCADCCYGVGAAVSTIDTFKVQIEWHLARFNRRSDRYKLRRWAHALQPGHRYQRRWATPWVKTYKGRCVYLNTQRNYCSIHRRAPRSCRAYQCCSQYWQHKPPHQKLRRIKYEESKNFKTPRKN